MPCLWAVFVIGSWLLVEVSASARPLPKVAVVLASTGVGDAVPPLLQGLRLLEDQGICSPMALTFDPRTAKRLGKAVGEEYNELVLHPSLCVPDVAQERGELKEKLRNTRCAVLCFRSDSPVVGLNNIWNLLNVASSSKDMPSNLAVLMEIMEEIGVGNFLLFRDDKASGAEEEDRFLGVLRAAKMIGRRVSVVEASPGDGPTPLTLSRLSEDGDLLPSTFHEDER